MSLAWRRPRPSAPIPVQRWGGSASLPLRRLTPSSLASLFYGPAPQGATSRSNLGPSCGEPSQQHNEEQAPIQAGREPTWADFYTKLTLWSIYLLDNLEQTFPLQPVVTLTPCERVLQVWEAHIGSFKITSPALLGGQPWLLPRSAREWWNEDYAAQLARAFPREDITFLLDRAEDIVAILKAGGRVIVVLRENLYWLTSEAASSVCSSPTTSASSAISPSSLINATRYTHSVLQAHLSKVTSLGCTFSSVHRLPPLLAVIAVLLAYHRSRARWESAAIALREKEGRSTPADADAIRTLGQIAQWHVEPEMKLEKLRLATEEWFARGQRAIRDLGRLGSLIENRLRTL